MNLKVNKSELKNFKNLVSCGYCELQYLLRHFTRVCYVSNRDGWQCDVFSFENFAIVTGYNTPKFAMQLSYDLTVEVDREAKKILLSEMTQAELRAALEQLLDKIQQFIKTTKKGVVK